MVVIADKGTTSIGLVHEALYGAVQRGIDVQPVLREAGIDPGLLDAPQARVSAMAFSRLWVALADRLDDEFFAIDAHPLRRGSFRLMCHVALGCQSLEQALRRILSFLRATLDDIYGELTFQDNWAVLIIHDRGIERRLFSYGTWLILVHGLLCWLGGRRLPIHSISFRPAQPLDDSDYRLRFCESLTFGVGPTTVRFDRALLALKVVQTPATLTSFLEEAPGNLLVKYRNDESTGAKVRQRLRGVDPESWPEFDRLAKSLGTSSSTLQRRLQSEGLSYQRLKDDLRRDMAIHLLGREELTVNDVALQAGFQDASAFHRAFKKWTGVSPGFYRRAGPDEK